GPAGETELRDVLGTLPQTTPADEVPPGRGYARLGSGPVHRVQVPATPDPYDDATSEAQRQAVVALLPERVTPGDREVEPAASGTGVESVPEPADEAEALAER
ncbi:hypothetical protein GTW43_35495, partial [Streptomyces sp. SID5785]|nr:hypothetical protein [Streptomyces sp. SID5785]